MPHAGVEYGGIIPLSPLENFLPSGVRIESRLGDFPAMAGFQAEPGRF